MLQTLKIKNVALIDEATLNFDEKLNVISGETGAGKSIMLDSLSFVFGGRADKTLIRSGETSMKVEAVFNNINHYHKTVIKNELSIDCDDELFLSRELDIKGKNTCKINGELVPVVVVKKVCQMLVDIHGQSEHLAILDNDYQLKIIDLFSKKSEELLSKLEIKINEYKDIEKEISGLGGSEQEKQNLIDLYTYQINEIEHANVKENEYEELSLEKKGMQQYEKINDNLKQVQQKCAQNSFEETAVDKINYSIKCLNNIKEISPHYQELLDRFNSVLIELEDLKETINEDMYSNIFDEDKFENIDNRLDFIKILFRKYGGNFENLNKYYLEIKEKLNNLINSAEKYKELQTKKEDKLIEIDKIQDELSAVRHDVSKEFIKKMEQELKNLGMPNAKMDIEISRIAERFSYTGYDRIDYMFSANLGFELKQLNKVVSGGEMSRVMLAYKIVVSEVDDIHTIVFDEVDSGLSGNIASVVAEYMARLSNSKQIIAVSHLPQICAMADRNIKVEKYSNNNTTHTEAKVLEDDLLYQEIARLMGAEINSAGIDVSKNLKYKSENYKNNLK